MNLLPGKKPLENAAQSDIGQALKGAARSTLVSALGAQSGNGASGDAGPASFGAAQRSKPLGWAAKPVLMVASAVAGATAASAVVSAVRRAQGDG